MVMRSRTSAPNRSWLRSLSRLLTWTFMALLVLGGLVLLMLLVFAWRPMGASSTGERLERMHRSAQWGEGGFENPRPLSTDFWLSVQQWPDKSIHATPAAPLPVERVNAKRFLTPPTGVRVTWLGHSTTLIEVGERRVLTDPVWGPTASPLTFLGPARWYPPPLALEDLPPLDAVLISHDHYDHLDYSTIVSMKDWDTRFVVPLGVGAHLAYWGVPASRIVELDWWEEIQLQPDLKVVCTPARHASGRRLLDKDATLWAGYAVVGEKGRVYFSGDTGFFPEFAEIGERLGPFDITMVEVGAYNRAWPDWHSGPEQAVRAHQLLGGKLFMPIHWGLFDLALHSWTEPIERTMVEADKLGVQVAMPKPGQSVEPLRPPQQRWWPQVPWQSVEEHPVWSGGF